MQPIGAFKLRGAMNAVAALPEGTGGVTCCSTGNHGRGVAFAAAARGLRAVICMSSLVPQAKVAGIRALGAEVNICGISQDEALAESRRLVDAEGLVEISPFDDPYVIAGQGTIGLEMMEARPDLDTILVPLSGGGLAAGVAVAAKSVNPAVRVIGISMDRGAAMHLSLAAGHPVEVREVPSLADSLGGGIGMDNQLSFSLCRDYMDGTVLVSEAEIRDAMERTHRWALRSLEARVNPEQALFAIVQGGVVPELRRESADFLTQHDFDGFALGGLAVGDTRAEREAITALASELLPEEKPRYLMGVGTPADLLVAMRAGIDLFDCMLPTHLAWQGTAFTSTGRVKITRSANAGSDERLDVACACRTCECFSRGYLHHLFACKEPLGSRLLSLHNLTHYNALMDQARAAIEEDGYDEFSRRTLDAIDRHEHADGRLGAAP